MSAGRRVARNPPGGGGRFSASIAGVHRARSRIVLWIAAAAIAVVAGVGVWKRAVRPNLFPKNFGVVEAGQIYRSGELSPEAMRRVVSEHGIRTVVDLGAHKDDPVSDRREQRTCDALGVTRYAMRLEGDSTGNPNYYVQALRLMSDPEKRPVLVHCNAGAERTGCAVILYRHFVQGKGIEEVYPETFEYRHSDERNPKLRETLNKWGEKIGAAFRDGGLISEPGVGPLDDPVPVAPVVARP